MRIDIAPVEYKQRLQHNYEATFRMVTPIRSLYNRATVGFESAINS
jgi:hypothetical protein